MMEEKSQEIVAKRAECSGEGSRESRWWSNGVDCQEMVGQDSG